MSPDDRSGDFLADDPEFQASLAELDRGLSGSRPAKHTDEWPPFIPTPLPAIQSPSDVLPPSPLSDRDPDRLLDLFPADTADARAPFPADRVDTLAPLLRDLAERRPASASPSTTLLTKYEQFYGFAEQPFTLTADLKFVYHTAEHDRAAQELLTAIRQRAGIVVLTGPPGIGKTTLCRTVTEQLDQRTLTSLVAEPFLSAEELLTTVLLDFGVISRADAAAGRQQQASPQELGEVLQHFLSSLGFLRAFAVVIIDEAQTVPAELLEQIRRIAESNDERLLQIMLVGPPSLEVRLRRGDLRDLDERVVARCTLGPLGRHEMRGYVNHRLTVAGSMQVDFDDTALGAIHTVSGGVPRVVNAVCDRALSAAYTMSSHFIDANIARRAAAELGLTKPEAARSPFRAIVAVAVLLLLMMVGAAAGAFVFRARLSAAVAAWVEYPQPPTAPGSSAPAPYVAPTLTEERRSGAIP